MLRFLDMARMTVASAPDIGDIQLGSAVTGFQTFAAAGAQDGDIIPYGILDGNRREEGDGTYHAGTPPTLSRTTINYSTSSGLPISASGAAYVYATSSSKHLRALTTNLGCGRLTYVSPTAINFVPYNGDLIKINGVLYRIPAFGIGGLGNTGIIIDGAPGSSLAANTTYLVYAFISGGVVTAEFSTTGHATSATDGNVGTEIKNGDNTRSLIGIVRTNASAQFENSLRNRFVRSWFNPPRERFWAALPGLRYSYVNTASGGSYTGYPAFVELQSNVSPFPPLTELRCGFVLFAGESVFAHVSSNALVNSNNGFLSIGWDGVVTQGGGSLDLFAIFSLTIASTYSFDDIKTDFSEGYHYATMLGAVASGSIATFYQINTYIFGEVRR